jgi:uncharacterized protein YecE (DUF72 family)
MATKKFDPVDFEAFLKLLPKTLEGRPLRHCVEVRHASFAVPEFVQLCRRHNVAIVLAAHAEHPMIPDVTADFVYARLMTGTDECDTCYPPDELDLWAERIKTYAAGGVPSDLPLVDPAHPADKRPRECFVFFIHEAKVRAPAGAVAFLQRTDR